MKTIMTAAIILIATITSAHAGWVSTPNFKEAYCEAHPETRTIGFGVLVIPIENQVGIMVVFGKGTKTTTKAYVEFGPHKYGEYPVGDMGAWSSQGVIAALAQAEKDGISIRVQKGDEYSWFVMQGFLGSVKGCVEMMFAKGA